MLDGVRLAARFRELEVELDEPAPPTLVAAVVATACELPGAGHPDPSRRSCARSGRAPPILPTSSRRRLSTSRRPRPRSCGPRSPRRPSRLARQRSRRAARRATPRDVHQARVATRRLRSDLRTFRLGASTRSGASRSATSSSGSAALLGDGARHRGAARPARRRGSPSCPTADIDAGERLLDELCASDASTIAPSCSPAMRSERYLALLDRWSRRRARRSSDDRPPTARRLRGCELADFVAKPWRKLRNAVHDLDDDPPDHELHAVRIRGQALPVRRRGGRARGRQGGQALRDGGRRRPGRARRPPGRSGRRAVAARPRARRRRRRGVRRRASSCWSKRPRPHASRREQWPAAWKRGEAQEAPPVDVTLGCRGAAASCRAARTRPTGTGRSSWCTGPAYDDWSLPKGKADPGERDEETALREVEEETGLRCTLGAPAGRTRYRDSKGRTRSCTTG